MTTHAPAQGTPAEGQAESPPRTARRSTRRRLAGTLGLLTIALALACILGLAVGSIWISPMDAVAAVGHAIAPRWIQPTGPGYVQTVVLDVRAPRVLTGAVVGAGLAIIGCTLQALVRNPLADPYLLGVSSGASVGAVGVLILGLGSASTVMMPAAAFAGALVATIVVYLIARAGGVLTTTRLVLAGVAVAYVLSAVTSLILVLASNADRSRQILTWLLGGLGASAWSTVPLPLVVVAAGIGVLLMQSRALNVLLAGDQAATSLGLDVVRLRAALFVLTSLLTGVLVAVSGPIGFVGLIVPHAVRMLVGADHRRLLPCAALAGAAFLVIADLAARTVASPQEVPVGVLTALCGGPFFLWLIRRDARRTVEGRTR